MRYGVVGASGTLGQVVVRQLLARSTSGSVNALVRKPDRSLAALDRCEIFVGGIFDDDQLENFVKASDVVINFAARNPVGNAEDRQNCRDFFDVNGIGAATVAAVAARTTRVAISGQLSACVVFRSADQVPLTGWRCIVQPSARWTTPCLEADS